MKYIYTFLYTLFSLLLFIYLVWPYTPSDINSFSDLPNSKRSTLSGDTVQVPNLKAYFSNNYRNSVVNYYKNELQNLNHFPFQPLGVNRPPEDAYATIKDQTQSTYLEEYTYPGRGSLFINGLEPFDEKTKEPRFSAATTFTEGKQVFETKVTLRYYPTSPWERILTWLMMNIALVVFVKSFQIKGSKNI